MSSQAVDRAVTRIFDLIDGGKLGLAEGVLEETLPKFPDNHAVLAAEALLLLKQGQADKAKEKAETLSQQDVKDGKAVNALIHVLQQCCSWVALAQTYEHMKEYQNEKGVLENLVQTYVRMGDYNKAHKTAVLLHRKWNDPRYQVWIVQAGLSQVPADASDHVLLKVSSRLLDKAVLGENGLITPSTSRMYVEVLHQQKLYSEALTFLYSARGAAVGLPEARLELVATTMQCSGDLAKANAVAKHLWMRQPDNWTYVELYLNSLCESDSIEGVLELDGPSEEKRASIPLGDGDHTLGDALRFCRTLQDTVAAAAAGEAPGGRMCRGPFMAELEILARQHDTAALELATVSYAQRFYRTACCFLDISTYLNEASAAAIYSWAMEENDAPKDALQYHTRRILGLRCHVAQWGAKKEEQPDNAAVESLLQVCRRAYEEARPLSARLAWSEEGLCDGYITVSLNVALHVYHATKDVQWAEKGLAMLDAVERKPNNPTWLIYAVCFARILGLADVDASRQLAFKSVQHDTMSHLGYWPLVSGCAVEEMCHWNELAWGHYHSLQKDCSLLRSKVFAHTSWPAMKDVQEYERRQMNSIARVICAVHRIVAALRECQTQRNVFDLMEREESAMVEAFEILQTSRVLELSDNTDWTVARSVVLGNIHGEKVHTLTDSLVEMPSMEERIEQTRRLLGSLLLLHDVALLEAHRIKVANAPKPLKKKKGRAQVEQQISFPKLLCKEQDASLPTLPAISSIAPALLDFVKTHDNSAALPHTAALHDSLETLLTPQTSQRFLFPEAFILTALLQVGSTSRLPIVAWAQDLHMALKQIHEFQGVIERDATTGVLVQKLRELKASRMSRLLDDLLRDVLSAARRR